MTIGAVVLLCFMFDLLELPIEAPPLFGLAVLLIAGPGQARAGGRLPSVLGGAAGAIGLALIGSALVHRAFGQTPWRMYAGDFLPLMGLTVGLVMATVGIGWLVGSALHGGRRLRRAMDGRGLVGAFVVGVVVVGAGTLLAEMVQAIVPGNAQVMRISVHDDTLHVEPSTIETSRPTYVQMEADAELMYLPVTSDADAARRMSGDLVDRDGLAGYMVPRELANNLRRVQFERGRYVLVAVGPEVPMDESTVLILDPGDPPPDTRTMRADIAPVEFTVTD